MTSISRVIIRCSLLLVAVISFQVNPNSSNAASLPEDLYALGYSQHSADGVDVSGAILHLRKQVLSQFSLGVSYRSEQLQGGASDQPRITQSFSNQIDSFNLNGVLLRDRGLLEFSLNGTDSDEYTSKGVTAAFTQEFFAGLQSLHLGLGHSKDQVNLRLGDQNDQIDRYSAHIGWQQVWSKTEKVYLDYQFITEQGFLADPYAESVLNGGSFDAKYPDYRTSHSLSLRYQRFLAKNSSASVQYQYYNDTWDIVGHLVTTQFQRKFKRDWQLQVNARLYTQTQAFFYSNNSPLNLRFLAKDKELSDFYNAGLGFNLRKRLSLIRHFFVEEAFLNIGYQASFFEFDNYELQGAPYSFQSDLLQVYLTAKL